MIFVVVILSLPTIFVRVRIHLLLMMLCADLKFLSDAPKLKSLVSDPVSEGSTFNLFCSVTEGSIPLYFKWSKDGHLIPSVPGIDIKKVTSRSSVLEIEEVSRNDSGNYSCFAENAFGTDITYYHLVVYGRAK